MLKPIENPAPIFTAPLAMLKMAERDFPSTINEVVQAAIANTQAPSPTWGHNTYVPARVVLDILSKGKEGEGRGEGEKEHIAANVALSLAWAQSTTVLEVGKQRYLAAASRCSPYKGLPVDRLRALPEYALCFSTESFRVEEKDDNPTLLMVLVYFDELYSASNKLIPELTIALLYDHKKNRQLKSQIIKIPMSSGLSYLDAVRRAKRHGKDNNPMLPGTVPREIREKQLIAEAMQASIVMELAIEICAELRPTRDKPSIVLPNDLGQVAWPAPKVFEVA